VTRIVDLVIADLHDRSAAWREVLSHFPAGALEERTADAWDDARAAFDRVLDAATAKPPAPAAGPSLTPTGSAHPIRDLFDRAAAAESRAKELEAKVGRLAAELAVKCGQVLEVIKRVESERDAYKADLRRLFDVLNDELGINDGDTNTITTAIETLRRYAAAAAEAERRLKELDDAAAKDCRCPPDQRKNVFTYSDGERGCGTCNRMIAAGPPTRETP